ncbi:MAG: glycosyl transferase [Planctomycetota bacterium]
MTRSQGKKPEPRLLYFSPVFLQSYPQRPHYFIRHFLSRPEARVLWVNPYLSRLLKWGDLRQSMALHDQNTPLPAGLQVQTPFALPLEPLPGGTALNALLFWGALQKEWRLFAEDHPLMIGIGKPSRLALMALRTVPHQRSFFDMMDNFPAFHSGLSRRSMERTERRILSLVDELYVSSSYLEERMSGQHRRVKKVLNAYDMQKLPPVRGSRPEGGASRSWEQIRSGKEICFGYVGSIASWFDWRTVLRLAETFPGHPIHLVGPLFVPLPARLPEQIRIFGPCSHEEALAHAQKFTLGLIPFKQSLLTAGVDPIKYYEYRGLGLPILSTRFGEMALRTEEDGVFFLDTDAPFEPVVQQALAWRPGEKDAFRKMNDWERRLAEARLFEGHVGGR